MRERGRGDAPARADRPRPARRHAGALLKIAPALLLFFAACGATARQQRPTALVPEIDEGRPAALPDLSHVPGWSGPDVTSGRPVRFVAENGGPILRAAVLDKTTGDHHALLLVVSQLGGEILATAPLGELDVGGTRELLSHLAPWRFAPGSTGVRIDLSVFERAAPRRFAVKSLLVAVGGNQARVVLDRLVESGDDARDRRATLVARDDGQLVVEERESGQPRPRTLTYRLGKDGVYETGDVSIFDAR